MGMSSSQARLLNLTARMHQIEYKAAKVEAQKLQMANESHRVYENYLKVLDARKLQYKAINNDGSITYKDATMNSLQNGMVHDTSIWSGDTSATPLFMQRQNGSVLITPAIAQQYGLSNTKITEPMDDYIRNKTHRNKSTRLVKTGSHWEPSGVGVENITTIGNDVTAPTAGGTVPTIYNIVTDPVAPTAGGLSYTPIANVVTSTPVNNINYSTFQIPVNTVDTSSMTDIMNFNSSNIQSEYVIKDVNGLTQLATLCSYNNSFQTGAVKPTFYLSSDLVSTGLDMEGIDWDGINTPNYVTIDGNGVTIKNLGKNANATHGVFKTVGEQTTIRNLGIENVSINLTVGLGNSDYPMVGALAYSATDKCKIENCYATGTITGTNCMAIGGLVGMGGRGAHINNCNTNINIVANKTNNSTTMTYGLGGIVGYNDVSSTGSENFLHITNCWTTGTITQNSTSIPYNGLVECSGEARDFVGGIIGGGADYQTATIDSCISTVELKDGVNGGHIGGKIIGYAGWADSSLSECSCRILNTKTDSSINPGLTIIRDGDPTILCQVSELSGDIKTIVTPSLKRENNGYYTGGLYSNIYGALHKYYNGNETQINANLLQAFCVKLINEDHLKIANMNKYICDYINGTDTTGGAFITALVNAVNDSYSNYNALFASEFQNVYDSSYSVTIPTIGESWTPVNETASAGSNGKVKLPTVLNIADMLYAKFVAAGKAATKDDVKIWVSTKYNSTSAEGMKQLADLNDAIHANKINDIYASFSASPKVAYIAPTSAYNTSNYDFEFLPHQTVTDPQKGSVKIPTIEDISDMLYYNLVKAGRFTLDDATYTKDYIRNWVNSNFTTSGTASQAQMATLADVNTAIQAGNAVNVFNNPASYKSATPTYSTTNYDFSFKGDQNVTASSGGSYVDDYTEEEYWDTSIPEIADAMTAWLLGQRGIEIISTEQASNPEYIMNMLDAGEAVLTTFNPAAASQLNSMTEEQRAALSDEDFDKLLGIQNTSPAVDTSVQEVADEKELKKAEAKYEADMRKIDAKDRKYDTELAALDTERNALKQEMDTLKTVAKENVERTFKLFS